MATESEYRNDNLFPLLELAAPVEEQDRNLVLEMVENRLPGVIIRGLYDQASMALVSERIAAGDARDALFAPPSVIAQGTLDKHHHYYGMNLVTPKATMAMYQDYARRFDTACRELFRDLPDFRTMLLQTAGRMGTGMNASAPSFPDGEPYTFATIRGFPPGLEVPLHCGNRMLQILPKYEHLRSITDGDADQLSFFMPISAPDSGGELILYDLYWDASHVALSDTIHGNEEMMEKRAWQSIRLAPGDIIFFNGGRIYHRVSLVEGTRLRRTIGGFLSVSKDHERMYLYS